MSNSKNNPPVCTGIVIPSDESIESSQKLRSERNLSKAKDLVKASIYEKDESVYVVKHSSQVNETLGSSGNRSGGFFTPENDPIVLSQQVSKFAPLYEKDEEQSNSEDESYAYLFNRTKRRRLKNPEVSDQIRQNNNLLKTDQPNVFESEPFQCDECNKKFSDSILIKNFDCEVCDGCYDRRGIHTLITRTTAKERYLLKDVDIDVREPVLKYILKRNPHNSTWGDMRLYLEAHVAERALELWGSEEGLEAERERRKKQREQVKVKRFEKRIKDLRVEMRSSLYSRKTKSHEHEYSEEVYDEENDVYVKSCKTCNFEHKYEKM